MFLGIIGIDLFDQNVGMTYAEVRLRCLWIGPKRHFRTHFPNFGPKIGPLELC